MADFKVITPKRDIARELARKYSTMTHDELDVVEDILEPIKYGKGEMILPEGEQCMGISYIEKGLVRQFYFKNGKEVTEHLGVDHSIFMCIESLFKEEPTRLQVEALEPTLVYMLPKKKLEAAAMRNVNIQMLYRKILEESLIRVAILGATVDLGLLWSIAETFNGLMAIPNLIGVFLLSGTAITLTKEYFAQK